jgi:hypothetical protein
MTYKNFSSQPTSILTASERSREARRILEMLREEDSSELERKLTDRAREFIQAKWLEMDLGGQLNVTEAQYWWLMDSWAKFA